MRSGDRLVLSVGNINIEWMKVFNDEKQFPIDKIFNFAEWRKEANYKKILKPEEDVDYMGNKNMFSMNDKFNIVIL